VSKWIGKGARAVKAIPGVPSDLARVRDVGKRLEVAIEVAARAEDVATSAATWKHPARVRGQDQVVQHLARLEWRRIAESGGRLPSLDEVHFRFFSQNGEDGIIWFLLSLIGDGNRRAVEICAGDGVECCTANLAVNHGWECLMIDGDPELVARGQGFYRHSADAWYSPPTLVNAWVTAETVTALLQQHGFDTDVDVLVLDLDGMDYWIWKAIEMRPALVVVEVNQVLGPEVSVAVPYDPAFVMTDPHHAGASLRAWVGLAESRGYRLVGVERYNFNAFFVRNDLAPDLLPACPIEACFDHVTTRRAMAARGAGPPEESAWVQV